MNHDRPGVRRIRIGRFADEAENGQWMIGHAVIGPAGVVVLPDGTLAHVGPIFLLLDLLEEPNKVPVVKSHSFARSETRVAPARFYFWPEQRAFHF